MLTAKTFEGAIHIVGTQMDLTSSSTGPQGLLGQVSQAREPYLFQRKGRRPLFVATPFVTNSVHLR